DGSSTEPMRTALAREGGMVRAGGACGSREEPGPKRGLPRLGGGSESSSAAARATGGAPSTRFVRDGVPAGGAPRAVTMFGSQDRPLPDYETFAKQVKAHLAPDEERQSGYMFNERRM